MRRAVLIVLTLLGARASAVWPQGAVSLGSQPEDQLRLRQIIGDTSALGFLLRSTSSLSAPLANNTGEPRRLHWSLVWPEVRYAFNSTLPYSLNDGSLWAGRGSSASIGGGARAEIGPLRILVLPAFSYSDNAPYPLTGPPFSPVPPPTRNAFSSPWHANGQSIDLPIRFGAKSLRELSSGQSTAMLDLRGVTFGVSTENEWWGPGIRNALILSNHAAGFEHAFVRAQRPIATRIGILDARWIVGTLRESRFFDSNPTNDLRSISLLGVTWTPHRDSGLTLGAARAVFSVTENRSGAVRNAFQVFADVGHPNARPYLDSTMIPGRDQLISLFFRWVFPKAGLETYAEWARTEIPRSLRDFLLQPYHTQGYTLGLQWLGDTLRWNGRLRAQAEFTFLEQSTTYRFRDIGSWYTSRAVVQGYTNRGQSLGASIGPGSSSQWAALDYVRPTWQVGAFLTRIRWLEDAHSQQPYPDIPEGTRGWCEHDVSMLPGLRASVRTRFGSLATEYSSGWRLNVFFENPGPCPISAGRDVRNNALTLSFSPLVF